MNAVVMKSNKTLLTLEDVGEKEMSKISEMISKFTDEELKLLVVRLGIKFLVEESVLIREDYEDVIITDAYKEDFYREYKNIMKNRQVGASLAKSSDLSLLKCVPCEGWMKPLPLGEVRKLSKGVLGWKSFKNLKLTKEFVFKNFKETIAFINKVAAIAEKEGHHPDFFLHDYKKLDFQLSTHAIGGLSQNDFILAAKINKLKI